MTEPAFLTTTRAAYDTVAGDYAARFRDDLREGPLGRAMLAAFAELVRDDAPARPRGRRGMRADGATIRTGVAWPR